MAIRGQWTGGSTSLLPTTTWAAPNGLFSTEARNDDSAYSFASSTSTLTLPSSGLAQGYLLVAAFEFQDTSNGRHNPQGRIVQTSGTGNFVGGASSGYNRQTSEDRAYVRVWAFVDSPSAASTFQFQWQRDSDAPTGGTVRSEFEVIPLTYANHGIYSSASNAVPGGTTPNQVVGWSVVDESDTAAIELSSNVVTLKGLNKKYLALGSQYWEGLGGTRTQRFHGFRIDGTKSDIAKAYSYSRYAAADNIGEMFSTPILTAGATKTVDQFVYTGEARGTFPNSSGDQDGNTTGTNANHAMVILELPDSAELFHGKNITLQNLDVAGTRVAMNLAEEVLHNDSASFTKSSDTAVNVEQDMDMLLGANISGGYTTQSSARATVYAAPTINGVEQTYNFGGDYGRGDNSNQDTYGWSGNILGSHAVTAGQTIGVNAGKISGSEGGTVAAFQDWGGYWALNLDSLSSSLPDITGTLSATETGSDTASLSGSVEVSGSLSGAETGSDTASFTGTVSDPGITGTLSAQEGGTDTAAMSGSVGVSGALSSAEIGSDSASGAGSVTVTGNLAAVEAGQDTASFTGLVTDPGVIGSLAAQETGSDTASVSGTVDVTGALAAQETGQDTANITGPVTRASGGDDAPYRSSGEARRFFYDKQIAELEELETKVRRLKEVPPKKRAEQAQIIFEPFQAKLPEQAIEPLEDELARFIREETNYRQFRDAVSRYVEAVEQERRARRRRQNNDAAVALLFAA